MASSNRNLKAGWSSLLAEPDGPAGTHARALQIVADEARALRSGPFQGSVAGADGALAGRAVLRGAASCRDFLAAVAPLARRIAHKAATFESGVPDRAVVDLLSLAAIAATVGAPLALHEFDPGPRFPRLIVNKTFTKQDDVTVAWLALGLGRVGDVALLFGKEPPPKGSSADPVALVKTTAAALKSKGARDAVQASWTAYLAGFPAMLRDEKAEWRHLLLAARVVMGRIEGVPMGEVADALHRRVVELAREEAG